MLEDRVILKQNDIFVVSDLAGDIPAGNEDGLGLYRSDTRFLSTYELRVNGRKLRLILEDSGYDPKRAVLASQKMVERDKIFAMVGPMGSPKEIIAVAEVAPKGSCGPSDSVTYEPRKARDADALRGMVINRFPKMAVPRATLQLFDPAGALIAQQQTNERGEFQFKQTAPGRYSIAFQHPGTTTRSHSSSG